MNWVSVFCFATCLAIIASCFRRDADILSPARVFGFVWSLAIGLTNLKLSRLQHEWSAESWIQLLIGPVAFLVGIFIIYVMNLNDTLLPIEKIRRESQKQKVDERRLFVILAVLFVLYVMAYGLISLFKGGIPLFTSRPGLARMEFKMFGIGLFLHNLVLIVFFTLVYHLQVSGKKLRKLALKLMCFIVVVTYFLTLQRFQIVFSIVMCLVLAYYATRHLRLGTVSIYGACIALLIFWISSLRSGQLFLFMSYLHRSSQMTFSPNLAFFTEPYMYLAMNLENFARSIDRLDHFTFGYYTFDLVTALSGLKHWISEYFALNKTPYLISGYNTYTAFWTYYRDFGVLGVSVIPLLGGVAIGSTYYRVRKMPTLQNLCAYGIMVFLMVFSFFNSQIGFLWFVYSAALFYLILRWIVIKKSATDE